jgi:hypothetical protein
VSNRVPYSVECRSCGQIFELRNGALPLEEHEDYCLLPPGQCCPGSGLAGHPTVPTVVREQPPRNARQK